MEGHSADGNPVLTKRAQEYTAAAVRYREMAAEYLDIGKRA